MPVTSSHLGKKSFTQSFNFVPPISPNLSINDLQLVGRVPVERGEGIGVV